MVSEKKKKFDYLITGIAGYIGLNLAEYLLKKKFKVIGIDNFSNSKEINIKSLKNKFNNFEFYKNSFENIPTRVTANNVIHLAAKSVVEKKISDLKYYKINNILKLDIFLKKINNLECKKFIFISSAAIYKESNKKISENSSIKPKSYYGKSKFYGEKLIKKYSKKSKTQFTVLRLFNILGGKMLNTKNTSVLSLWRDKIKRRGKIIIHDEGNCVRDFVDIGYFNKIIYKININKKKYKLNIFNLGTGKKIKIKEMLEEVKKIKKKIKIKFKKLPINAIKNSICDNKKIIRYFNLKPKINMKKIVKNCLNEVI